MMVYLFILVIILCITMSLRALFFPNRIKGKSVSLENFFFLAAIYFTVLVGFGLIYFLIAEEGYTILIDSNEVIETSFIRRLGTAIYFSAITLFSVGYGDIAPVGIGRMIVVIEALIGYTIPAAFVARAVYDMEK